jgi:L-amino acid N-acyltransferase YncA
MIRPATADDASRIATLWNQIIRDTTITFTTQLKTSEQIAQMIANSPVFVAEDAGFGGFASYAQFRDGPGYARTMEHSIHLTRGARGKGFGRALLNKVEAHAKSGGAHSMIAGISAENGSALAFHLALGYRETGRLPQAGWKFERWIDLVFVQKFL